LAKDGNWWRLRWWEEVRTVDGKLKRIRRSALIGPCKGPDALSKKEAQARAWESVLSHVNATATTPASLITLGQYIVQHFNPEWVWAKKHAGKLHYLYAFKKIIPALGDIPLRDLTGSDIQRLVKQLIEAGYTRTAEIVRTVIHTVIDRAKKTGYFTGENPAELVVMPERERREPHALTWEQAEWALELLPSPYKEMALLSMTTSLNVAELCGLKWKRVNLSEQSVTVGMDVIPPMCLAVRENFYKGQRGTVKATARNRIQPIPAVAVPMLDDLHRTTKFNGPEDPVFASRNGTPVDPHNANNRVFKKLSATLGVKVTWHVFRHTCATFTEVLGMLRSDRIALMGHATGEMTDHYTHADIERRRGFVDDMGGRLMSGGDVPKTPTAEELEKLYGD